MSEGETYAWAVRTPHSIAGTHWTLLRTRKLARAFRRQHGGRLYHIIEAH
ncbi:hypothetical protein [Rhodanobacter hydrolyticus]|uniref:Uncharacterized protein n=1 Tax=Rhodanobacter hydrolyticus TaxID=2250595 RepID=A0ABW8J3Q2_9GAMM